MERTNSALVGFTDSGFDKSKYFRRTALSHCNRGKIEASKSPRINRWRTAHQDVAVGATIGEIRCCPCLPANDRRFSCLDWKREERSYHFDLERLNSASVGCPGFGFDKLYETQSVSNPEPGHPTGMRSPLSKAIRRRILLPSMSKNAVLDGSAEA